MPHPISAALAFAAALLCAPVPLAAPSGTIEGTVRDRSGAPIPNAQVLVVGLPHSALTDSTGAFRLPAVPVGTHRLRAAFIGYRAAEREGVVVREGKTARVDFRLEALPVQSEEVVAGKARREGQFDKAAAPSSIAPQVHQGLVRGADTDWNTENYAIIEESRFLPAAANPRSTFSIDVDAASYTNVRRFLTSGQRPPRDAVRIEEFLNYFRYDYPEPKGDAPFSVTTDLAVAPWAVEHRLVRVGIKGKSLRTDAVPASNLVFLLDVSGSMQPPNKLPLVKQAFRLLVQELRPQDRVAIVVYAGAAGLVLPSTPGSDKAAILHALDRLEAGGSTAGGAGLRLAYEIARQHYTREGNNRVILATDGDFNVGESSDAAMVRLIEERRDQGIFLTVLGFGTGNLKDSRIEQIADKGNGHYAYVDNLNEARRVFVREFAGTLVTIAKDVKIQVEFNPARVLAYRLVGYENRALRNEDFADDRKDAGELGAGHTVTALYEIVPTGASVAGTAGDLDSLKYQTTQLKPGASNSDEWLTVQLRYKEPTGTTSRLLSHPVRARGKLAEPAGDFRFASAVAAFGMVLRESEYRGTATLDQVLALARGAEGEDRDGERAEFVRLVESAKSVGLAQVGDDDVP
ncbi:MAG: von Willebrand factor type A domain-containing protein [Gemmatimonadales bacterium]